MISIKSAVSLWDRFCHQNCQYMSAKENTETLRQYESRFSLIIKKLLTFALSINLVREVKISLQVSSKLSDDVLSY